jgi:hypothetical protein
MIMLGRARANVAKTMMALTKATMQIDPSVHGYNELQKFGYIPFSGTILSNRLLGALSNVGVEFTAWLKSSDPTSSMTPPAIKRKFAPT